MRECISEQDYHWLIAGLASRCPMQDNWMIRIHMPTEFLYGKDFLIPESWCLFDSVGRCPGDCVEITEVGHKLC